MRPAARLEGRRCCCYTARPTRRPCRKGEGKYFTGGYARHVIPDVGHFPTREAPQIVSKLVLELLRSR